MGGGKPGFNEPVIIRLQGIGLMKEKDFYAVVSAIAQFIEQSDNEHKIREDEPNYGGSEQHSGSQHEPEHEKSGQGPAGRNEPPVNRI